MRPVKLAQFPEQAPMRVRVWLVKCTTNWRDAHHACCRALLTSSGRGELGARGRISPGVREEALRVQAIAGVEGRLRQMRMDSRMPSRR